MSAGGNDLVAGELPKVLDKKASRHHLAERHQPGHANYGARRHRRRRTRACWTRAMRCAPECVVVAHSYCYFQPSGRKATGPFGLLKAGPWMRPVLVAKGHRSGHRRARAGALPGRRAACATHGAGRGADPLPCRGHARGDCPSTTSTGPTKSIPAAPDSAGWRKTCWRPLLKAQFPGRGFD